MKVGDWAPSARDWKGGLCQSCWEFPTGEMGRLWPLRAPGEGLFLRLAALIIFFARRRWLALESRVLTLGDIQRPSVGCGGDVAEDVFTGLVEEKDNLL